MHTPCWEEKLDFALLAAGVDVDHGKAGSLPVLSRFDRDDVLTRMLPFLK